MKTEDDDAAYAAKLQAELNSLARPTRGAGTRKRMPFKKEKKKKKSAAKIKEDGETDEDGDDGETKVKKGGFHVRLMLRKDQDLRSQLYRK